MLKIVLVFFIIVGFVGVAPLCYSGAYANEQAGTGDSDDVSRVVGNVIHFV
ncbi:hypothetical protein [Ehrlichia chaffeensis]|uniref:hypothetical protein n=1 Tax=Ehrlichia chaffeensis TaxID=945 RepID=UPI000AAD9AC7